MWMKMEWATVLKSSCQVRFSVLAGDANSQCCVISVPFDPRVCFSNSLVSLNRILNK